MKRTAAKRRPRNTGPDAATVLAVVIRAHGMCEICGRWDADCQTHHRRPRAMGGTNRDDTNSPANLLRLCLDCHRKVESRRGEAQHNGWLVPQLSDPAQVAVLIHNGSQWVYLTATGEYADDPPERAA